MVGAVLVGGIGRVHVEETMSELRELNAIMQREKNKRAEIIRDVHKQIDITG